MQYTHFDTATDMVRAAGIGCFLSKVDIQHAFRLLPVHPHNWPLLGYMWDRLYFIDTVLPFGLRSSPGIFNQFADLVCWIMRFNFALRWLVHYSDDFLLVSCTNLELARKDLAQLVAAFKDLKIPLANDKILGPSCCMVYLGIEIDSVEQSISIPEGKYTESWTCCPNGSTREHAPSSNCCHWSGNCPL